MTEEHPSVSAVGSHLDEEIEIAALAHRYYEEEGCPEGRSLEHWLRAEREFHNRHFPNSAPMPANPPTECDTRTEEQMHLDQ